MVSVFPYCSPPSVLTQDCSVDLEFTDSLGCLPSTWGFCGGSRDLNSDPQDKHLTDLSISPAPTVVVLSLTM